MSMFLEFLLLEMAFQSSLTVLWEGDEFQDLNFEVVGTLVLCLGKVLSNSVTLDLVCVSIFYGPRSLV